MGIGDIVVVINTSSLPIVQLGQYGRVTELGPKVTVEFLMKVGAPGSFSHTAYPEDLMVVGKASSL